MKAFFVQVTVYDVDSGTVEDVLVRQHSSSQYGAEIERTFDRLAEEVVRILDPDYHQ